MNKMQEPIIIGVRHHSPACARLVADKIRTTKPRYILIEGPADFNERLDELYLAHQLPIAIYSYLSTSQDHHASWTPFLDYSPEWQGLMCGKEVGATVRFIDLPAWHWALTDTTNRYADQADVHQAKLSVHYEAALCERLNVSGHDALWDHLFEGETQLAQLEQNLQQHFIHLRQNDAGSLANQEREKMMSSWIAWAMAQDEGGVMVICGGYHAPALAAGWQDFRVQKGAWPPVVPEPAQSFSEEPDEEIDGKDDDSFSVQQTLRFGSYVVPYSFKRLDAFHGYASGMPSPAFYQQVWASGLVEAGSDSLKNIFKRLRQKNLPASTADLSSVYTRTQALANWRGHQHPLRSDYLDALAGSLIKTALDVPVPWSYRGILLPGTDPILVEIMDVLAGDLRGKLAPNTPQPPLVLSVESEMQNLQIPDKGEYSLDLLDQTDRLRSRCLHRLLLLDIPGVTRLKGPELAMSGEKQELWQLYPSLERRVALIEASMWGATLADAAHAKIEFLLQQAQENIAALANILNQAAMAGLNQISQQTLAQLHTGIIKEAHFEAFGGALSVLFPLWQYGTVLNMQYAPVLKTVLETAYDRMLWLLEPAVQIENSYFKAHINTHIELYHLVREAQTPWQTGQVRLDIVPTRAIAVWERKVGDKEAAPVSRGAALGALLSLQGKEYLENVNGLLDELSDKILGDALNGLLALARKDLIHATDFLARLDQRIQKMDHLDFMLALPAIRAAFGWLPSQERKAVARTLLELSQLSAGTSFLTQRLTMPAEQIAHIMYQEQKAVETLEKWGIVINLKENS